MKFQFDINLSEQDYFEYNKFWMMRSHYGKKQVISLRIMILIIILIFICLTSFAGGFSWDLDIIPLVIVLVLFQLFLPRFLSWTIKNQIKDLKKRGKMGYSSVSDLKFYEDVFIETTPENKTEQKYMSVERVSVVDNKVIYIHVNNIMSYILPMSCFKTEEQYSSFLEFIKTKCTNVDIY